MQVSMQLKKLRAQMRQSRGRGGYTVKDVEEDG